MSITKRLSVKAAKPQDQTCASKVQELTEAILADQTTGLSKAIDDAIVDSLVYGSSMLRVDAVPKQPGGYVWKYKASERYSLHGYSEIRMEGVPVDNKHFSTHMSTEQLRAAWLLEYGDRLVPLHRLAENEDMYIIGRQLYARGQLNEEKQFDTYYQCYYLKREHADR